MIDPLYLTTLYDHLRKADEIWSASVQQGKSEYCPETARLIHHLYLEWIERAKSSGHSVGLDYRMNEARQLTEIEPDELDNLMLDSAMPLIDLDEAIKPEEP